MVKRIEVHVREKDKKGKQLSLLNLRDEIVNFLYKDTVASSTKADMQFFVLVYFASLQLNGKTLLEHILDEAVPRFIKLNQSFQKKQGYLKANEYRAMVAQHGLTDLFKNDIFFVLIDTILNIETIKTRYASFYEGNTEFADTINSVGLKYSSQLESEFNMFKASKIEDDRYDDDGNYHDLSKSVYRTVRMRNARNLELNLQKYTSIQEITSRSPVDLSFIQYVDPQIIFDLWDKYHVVEYAKTALKTTWNIANTPLVSGILGGLVVKYTAFKGVNGAKERKRKRAAKKAFEEEKSQRVEELEKLNLKLVESVLQTNERLEQEKKQLRRELSTLRDKERGLQDADVIKKLEERIIRLENLEIETKSIEEDDDSKRPIDDQDDDFIKS